MDPQPTPEQIKNVTEGIIAALWFGAALIAYAYLSHQTEDNGPTRWQRWRAWLTARYMSSSAGAPVAADPAENTDDRAISLDETNNETAETAQRVAEIQAESFTLGETAALARLVAAEKLGLTDAVKIGADAKSGEKYQRRSRQIKAAVEQLQQKYRPLTPDQQALREQLELPPRR